jgi:uncharacterized repeat protein (TIGR01451 family)
VVQVNGSPLASGTFYLGEKKYESSPVKYSYGRTISGTVFEDNGAGGGIAYDGIKQGAEKGLPGITMTLIKESDGSGFTPAITATTGADGSYSLSLAGVSVPVKVKTTVPDSRVAVSEKSDNGGTLDSVTDSVVSNIPSTGSIAGVNFGQAKQPAMTGDTSLVAQPGMPAHHAITFNAYAPGSVSFALDPATLPDGWTAYLVSDGGSGGTANDCNGKMDPGEGASVSGAQPLSGSAGKVCLFLKVTPPGGATNSSSKSVEVTATMTYGDGTTPPSVIIDREMTAVTTVGQTVTLHKAATSDGSTAKTAAAPGDVIVYVLTYTNTTAKPVTNVEVTDSVPDYTTYVDPATLGGINAKCADGTASCVTAQPNAAAGWKGPVVWTISTLNSGATGKLEYRVRVDE